MPTVLKIVEFINLKGHYWEMLYWCCLLLCCCRSRRSDPSVSERRSVTPAITVRGPQSSVDAAQSDSGDCWWGWRWRRGADEVKSIVRSSSVDKPMTSAGDDGDIFVT